MVGDGFSLILPDLAAVAAFGRALLGCLRRGDVVALKGDLGAGKTALARAVIQAALGPEEEVPSPTFTLVQTYPLPSAADEDEGVLWHFDLYRIDRADDALELGIEEAFADGITLIEWPERLGPWLPADRLTVHLAFAQAATGDSAGGDGAEVPRVAAIIGHGRWRDRIPALLAAATMDG